MGASQYPSSSPRSSVLHPMTRKTIELSHLEGHLNSLIEGVSGVDTDEVSVSVVEGDSVTLITGVETKHQDRIRWYFNDIRIAQINGDQSKTCTDVQCNGDTERFRDRLKLDHQTGSLTITNTRNTDAGKYELKISSGSSESEKIFSVTIRGESLFKKPSESKRCVWR
ncbi:hypothetical protein DPX16_0811 [Anabarilius grahami]|uniref:Immunoglobulin domain-containing protein n=1 Tax=Anabarilius grahami TaxID=495550 RepID=A0A3N0Z9K4_ANAGA|nr:hypothetical protein DPX16_0811 [Anabarilius grahami]